MMMDPDPEPEPDTEVHSISSELPSETIARFYRDIQQMQGVIDSTQTSEIINSFYHLFINRNEQQSDFTIDIDELRMAVFEEHVISFYFEIRDGIYTYEGSVKIHSFECEIFNDVFVCARICIHISPSNFNTVVQKMWVASEILQSDFFPKLFDDSMPYPEISDRLQKVAFDLHIPRSSFDQRYIFDLFVVWIEFLAYNLVKMHI